MGRPLSLDLRRRILARVGSGQSRRAVAAKFDVSPSFVVALMKGYPETASLELALEDLQIAIVEARDTALDEDDEAARSEDDSVDQLKPRRRPRVGENTLRERRELDPGDACPD